MLAIQNPFGIQLDLPIETLFSVTINLCVIIIRTSFARFASAIQPTGTASFATVHASPFPFGGSGHYSFLFINETRESKRTEIIASTIGLIA